MNVAIYARYSSDNQRTESIDAQVYSIKKFAEQNNYKIVKTYVDEAKSARTDNRPAFQKMIKDSDAGLFQAIIVHKLDRFSRDRYDSAYYKRKLKNNDVKLLSVTENLSDNPESILLESLLEGLSEYYSANLAREVMKGLEENARNCKHTGGKPPFGFDVDAETKTYVINDNEAAAVREIFNKYCNDVSYSEISSWLDKSGFKTKYGKKFQKSSINMLLNNDKYIGVYTYKKKKRKFMNGISFDVLNEEEDMIIIPDGIPRIIDDEVWKMAQQKMRSNKTSTRSKTAKNKYLLTGKLVCGICGG